MTVAGLDRLFDGGARAYRGLRVGLIANPASVDSRLVHAAERFAQCGEFRLTALFAPQHGAKADRQDNMIESPDDFDERLGVPVYSLYGEHRKPAPHMLENVDVVFCDLTDAGARAYTFAWTMLLAMEACAEQGRRFVVLDRPNPIGGIEVEGNVLDPAFSSFIGLHPLPMRHGLTLGELARLLNSERGVGARLDVIEMRGWRREQWWQDTGLPWVMPSPNLASPETAAVYPGTVLVEGTNLSEGRGTVRPFELIGAPYLDGARMGRILNELNLPGVRFRPAWFRPEFDKWQGELCGGVQVHVTNRATFRPYRTGIEIVRAAMDVGGGQFAWRRPPFEYEYEKPPFDILAGTDTIRRRLESGARAEEIEAAWLPELGEFERVRTGYLVY
jgi:uncharacterized protein YbbC (DUF1343 family)